MNIEPFWDIARLKDSIDENFYSRISDNDSGLWMLCQVFLDLGRALPDMEGLIDWALLKGVTSV